MNEDVISQDDFLKAFGVSDQNAGADGTNDDNQDNNPTDGANPGTDGQNPTDNTTGGEGTSETGDNTGDQGDQGDQQNNAASKSAQAFAAMRVELAQKNKLLEGVATVLGLDPKSKESMSQLESKLTESLAKKQGIPVETLQRLNRLEELEQQRAAETVRNNAFAGFQQVKTQFGLNDTELQDFANELVAEGKNPFVQSLDLVTEYKLKNFDRLLEQAKNQGAQDEMARAAKANNNASTPGNKQGGAADQELDKITTIKQLTDWFNQQQSGK